MRDTHYHGLFAGVSAAAVLVVMLALAAWHAIGRAVGQTVAAVGYAVTVIVWALAAGVIAAVAYAVWVLVLRARLHVRHPETLMRQSVRGEVIPAQVVPAITGARVPLTARTAAALPPGWHVLPEDPDAAIAIIRAVAGEKPVIPGTAGDFTEGGNT